MLYKDKELPELYHLKHLHDTKKDIDFENNILKKSLSPILFMNKTMNDFILLIQKLITLKFDMFNIIKNWRNYNVDKYHYKHNK